MHFLWIAMKLYCKCFSIAINCQLLCTNIPSWPKQHNSSPDKLILTPPYLGPPRHPHSAPPTLSSCNFFSNRSISGHLSQPAMLPAQFSQALRRRIRRMWRRFCWSSYRWMAISKRSGEGFEWCDGDSGGAPSTTSQKCRASHLWVCRSQKGFVFFVLTTW